MMPRRHWQRAMIALARSEGWKRFMQSKRSASALAGHYVGGDSAQAGVETARSLAAQGIASSLFYLGEYVDSPRLVEENMAAKRDVISLLAEAGLDIHVSVDPTQVGCSIDWDGGAENIAALAQEIAMQAGKRKGVHCLMLDMEDFSVNGKTIALAEALGSRGLKTALTLQAYLRKTEADMRREIRQGAMVRLVKGAFAEDAAVAFPSEREIKENFRTLIDLMLGGEARDTGFYPVFATHDSRLQDYALERARDNGWAQGSYEFEMLYGARNDRARHLAERGERMRLYLPFGVDWWPYAVRRIGENPKNALLLGRGLLGV